MLPLALADWEIPPEYGAGSAVGVVTCVLEKPPGRTTTWLSACAVAVATMLIAPALIMVACRIAGGGVGVLDNAVEESGEGVRVAAAGAAIGVGHGADVDRARRSVRHISRRVTAEMRGGGAGAEVVASSVGRLVNAGSHAGEGIGRVIGGRICDHADIDRAVVGERRNALPAWAAVL